MIAQGRERLQAALQNPASIGDWAEPDENECEEILYAAQETYEGRTGEAFPYEAVNAPALTEPAGDPWEEDQLAALYPQLCEGFS